VPARHANWVHGARHTSNDHRRRGLLEAAVVALAGLTALAVLVQPRVARTSCLAPARADFERQPAPRERQLDVNAMLRDMRLHD
jgi:hypothetical protein